MKLDLPSVDRRTLLIGGGVGIGLVVGFLAWPQRLASGLAMREGEQAFGHFLKIGRDGRVIVVVPQVETGQGIWTGLAQIAADALGAAWEQVAVEPAPPGRVYANPLAAEAGWLDGLGSLRRFGLTGSSRMRMTAGSTSIRAFEEAFHQAGATARAMLIAAAADRWAVDPAECDTADGLVLHQGQTLTFGALAEEAAGHSPAPDAAPRAPAARLIGKPLPRLDLPAKSDGSFRFAADVRLPEMLFASARLAPPGGRLTGYSRAGAQQVRGVREIVVRDGWIAAIADSWWQAERALKATNPHFSAPEGLSSERLRGLFEQALEGGDADSWFEQGDYDSAVEGSRPLTARYWVAPAQHYGLEPLTATARFQGDRLEVWAPSQAPEHARAAAVAAAASDQVTFYPMPIGDGGGRALEAETIPLAVELARAVRRPVQLILSQAESQNHGRPAPAALAQMTALPGPGGITAAWKMRVATSDGLGAAIARLEGSEPTGSLGKTALDGAVPPYAIADISVEAVPVTAPFAAGYMRGHPQRAMTFFTESFIDELARAAGSEPLAFRMALLGGNPRLANCLQTAAAAADWDGGGSGSTLGIAACSAFGSHIGLVADAVIGTDQSVEVRRLVAAVDCGRIVNPQLVRQQIEGGLIWALGLATARKPEWVAGMLRSRPLGAAGLPKIARTPEIEVQLVPSDAALGGISGLGVAVLAPAVANALFAATGNRLRNLPFDPMAAA